MKNPRSSINICYCVMFWEEIKLEKKNSANTIGSFSARKSKYRPTAHYPHNGQFIMITYIKGFSFIYFFRFNFISTRIPVSLMQIL